MGKGPSGPAPGKGPKVLRIVEAEPRIVINVNVTVALDKTPKPAAVVEYVRKLRAELDEEQA